MTLRRSLRNDVSELKNRHPGEDIWVIASGSSMNFIAPEFFANKISIGVNDVYKRYKCNYLVRKELEGSDEAYAANPSMVLSEFDCGAIGARQNRVDGPAWYFSHRHNECTTVDLTVIGTDSLVVSYSTITSAMHLAAYMGAHSVLICGHDCGTLDGRIYFDGYRDDLVDPLVARPDLGGHNYQSWFRLIEAQSILVRNQLRLTYGCHIHCLNPFLTASLEGHNYTNE